MSDTLDQLGIYLLPGEDADPTPVCTHAAEAEALGIGTLWISEKFNQKDTSVLLGAVSQVTRRSRLGAGIVHPHTRHPLVLAAYGATMQVMSGNRFVLGFGRASPSFWKGTGLPAPTTESLRDTALMLRKLWAGETVSYRGPAGDFPGVRIRHPYAGPPPALMVTAVGPRTLAMAGEAYDGVITRPFLTAEAVGRAAGIVRQAAGRAGRDPEQVRIVHALVLGPELPPEREAAVLGGRLVRYLSPGGSAEQLPRLNGWDLGVVEAVRAHPVFVEAAKAGRRDFTLAQLAEVAADVIPEHWIRDGAAVGSAAECARRVQEYLDAGADEVLLHGNVPADLAGVVREFRTIHEGRA
jgi:probable F420-dependent oxidoreductase